METKKTEQAPGMGEEITNSFVDYKFLREYFEVGCLCILRGEVQKLGEEFSDEEAVEIYGKECKCSRHPEYGRGLFISCLDTN